MEINCYINKGFFKCYSEAKGVALNKYTILKKKKTDCMNYFISVLLIFVFLIILGLLFLTISNNICNYYLMSIIVLIAFVYLIFNFIKALSMYQINKKRKIRKSIILNEEGITYISVFDIKVGIDWSKIKAIVIKKYSITILTDTPCFFYLSIKQKDNLLKALNKYNKNELIIK